VDDLVAPPAGGHHRGGEVALVIAGANPKFARGAEAAGPESTESPA